MTESTNNSWQKFIPYKTILVLYQRKQSLLWKLPATSASEGLTLTSTGGDNGEICYMLLTAKEWNVWALYDLLLNVAAHKAFDAYVIHWRLKAQILRLRDHASFFDNWSSGLWPA